MFGIEFDKNGMLKFPKRIKETKQERWARLRRERYQRFQHYQDESKKTANNFGNTYKDEQLEKILECESNDYDTMLKLAKKFKRTWWGIKTIIEDRDYYLNNGMMKKTLWLPPKNDANKLDRFGEQLKKILDKNLDWFKSFIVVSEQEKSIYKF